MFTHIQLPIIDFRYLTTSSHRLNNPFSLLYNKNNSETPVDLSQAFIKNNGPFQHPPHNKYADVRPELYYFNARNSVKIPDLTHQNFNKFQLHSSIEGRFRRFIINRDNKLLSVYELGFADNVANRNKKEKNLLLLEQSTPQSYCMKIKKMISFYRKLPLTIHNLIADCEEEKEKTFIEDMGKFVSKLYLQSTTMSSKIEKDENIKAGQPIGIFEIGIHNQNLYKNLNDNDLIFVAELQGIKLYGYNIKNRMAVWIIFIDLNNKEDNKSLVNNLRLNLLRIHQEQEAIRILSKYIEQNSDKISNSNKKKIETHLNILTEKILSDMRYSIKQTPILEHSLKMSVEYKIEKLKVLIDNILDKNLKSSLIIFFSEKDFLQTSLTLFADKFHPKDKELHDAISAKNWKRVIYLLRKDIKSLAKCITTVAMSATAKDTNLLVLLNSLL